MFIDKRDCLATQDCSEKSLRSFPCYVEESDDGTSTPGISTVSGLASVAYIDIHANTITTSNHICPFARSRVID
jgi:hypothetical protein